MTDLHSALLARIHRGDPYGVITAWKAVRAAVELHAPRQCDCREAKHIICSGCPGHAVVCATERTIAEALGVEIGETP